MAIIEVLDFMSAPSPCQFKSSLIIGENNQRVFCFFSGRFFFLFLRSAWFNWGVLWRWRLLNWKVIFLRRKYRPHTRNSSPFWPFLSFQLCSLAINEEKRAAKGRKTCAALAKTQNHKERAFSESQRNKLLECKIFLHRFYVSKKKKKTICIFLIIKITACDKKWN